VTSDGKMPLPVSKIKTWIVAAACAAELDAANIE
jgi:hypothetical protein